MKKGKTTVKIKYEVFGNTISREQVDERCNFSRRFKRIANKYLKHRNEILPSEFRIFWIDNNCVPFWNENVEEISKKIFMPTVDLLTKVNDKFSKGKWFDSEFYKSNKKHHEKIRCIPNSENGDITKNVKIHLKCNAQQKEIFKRFMGVYRYFYNRTIIYAKNINKDTKTSHYYVDNTDEKTKITINVPESKYNWKSLKQELLKNKPSWMNDINFNVHSCQLAMKEALDNIITNCKKGRKFKMNLKTKKDLYQTIRLEKVTISKDCKLFKNYKNGNEYVFRSIKFSENPLKYNFCDFTITYFKKLNKFIMNLPYEDVRKENKKSKVCAIDPGVNNFVTGFSENEVFKIGISSKTRIEKLCKEVDILQSRMDKKYYYKDNEKININSNRKRNLMKAKHRKLAKIKNLRLELHNQTINYLVSNYSKIIISPFETQEMVSKLHSRTARMMNTLSFYKFRMKLMNKCDEMNNICLVKPEFYTSKTCTRCGYIKDNLGGSKVFNCESCNLTIERDYNGARNIMLKNNY